MEAFSFTDNTECEIFTTQTRHLNLWSNPVLQEQAEHCVSHLLGEEEGLGCANSYPNAVADASERNQGEQHPFGGEKQEGASGNSL